MSAMTTVPTLNFFGVMSESRRIISAHSRHFLALSVLFLLPLSFSLFIYPTLQSTLSQSDSDRIQSLLGANAHRHISDYQFKTLALPLVYSLFVVVLSLCAVATITYSTYHGFYGRPVRLVSAIKSLLYSLVPLIATTVASEIIVVLIAVAFGLFVGLVSKGTEFLGFEIDYNSSNFYGFCYVVSIIYLVVVLYMKVNWSLAGVIVVVESKWGFEPLRRSNYLVRGMRLVPFSIMVIYGASIGLFVWGVLRLELTDLDSFSNVWMILWIIVQIVLSSFFVTMFMLNYMASFTVLYMYCKALHGELAWEIAEEFATEYVSLPFDDEKVPHVVYVAQA